MWRAPQFRFRRADSIADMKPLRACRGIAAGQHGAIARCQALAEGMTARQIHGCLASGRWRIELPATYALVDFPRTWWQQAKAAELWAGPQAAVTHSSAAFLWSFEGFAPGPVEVATTRRLRSTELILHRAKGWEESELATRAGIRLTAVERTIADLAGSMNSACLEALVDDAMRRRLTSERRISNYLAGIGRGPQGVASLREVLAARRSGPPAESPLESMLDRLLRRSNLPAAKRQHTIVHEGRFVARVDFAWPAYMVAVEAQGRTHHGDSTFDRDLARITALSETVWTVLYVTWNDVHRRPRQTLELFERVLRRAGLR